MSESSATVDAPTETVWGVLSDPRTFEYFVVGSRRVRRFDPGWPEVGTTLHHTVGLGPLSIRDSSTVVAADEDRFLALDARFRPFGIARVEFHLSPEGAGTALTIREFPIAGLLSAPLLSPLVTALFTARNREVLRRIGRLAEQRRASPGKAA